jgi:hypothetical protein
MKQPKQTIEPYLHNIRALPFVEDLEFSQEAKGRDSGIDGILKLHTPKGTQVYFVETKRSYLDTGLLHALLAQAKVVRDRHKKPLLVFARYVPTSSAEKLIKSGINFIDEVGNMHLSVGRNYERTVMGHKQKTATESASRLTPAVAQLLFTFAADPDAPKWSVRQLAQASGVSKSNVAKVRQQLLERGLLRQSKSGFHIVDRSVLHDELLQGYERALRPKLVLGRFRSPDVEPEGVIDRVRSSFSDSSVKWSLTGGPAANLLQRFYRGVDVPLFVETLPDVTRRRLRLLPDKTGPLTFLNSFGTLPFWKEIEGVMVAHPWLIYAELMSSPDPRAHEAAQEIKSQYLSVTNA